MGKYPPLALALAAVLSIGCGSAVEDPADLSSLGISQPNTPEQAGESAFLGTYQAAFNSASGSFSLTRVSTDPSALFSGLSTSQEASTLGLTFSDVVITTDQTRSGFNANSAKLLTSGIEISVNDETYYDDVYLMQGVTIPDTILLEATKPMEVGNLTKQTIHFGRIGGRGTDRANAVFLNATYVDFLMSFNLYGTKSEEDSGDRNLSRIRSWQQGPIGAFGERQNSGTGSVSLTAPAQSFNPNRPPLDPIPAGAADKWELTISGSASEAVANGYCYTLGDNPTCRTPEDGGAAEDDVLVIQGYQGNGTEDLKHSALRFYNGNRDPVGDDLWLTRYENAFYFTMNPPCTGNYFMAVIWYPTNQMVTSGGYLYPRAGAQPEGAAGFGITLDSLDERQEYEAIVAVATQSTTTIYVDCDVNGMIENDGNSYFYAGQFPFVSGGSMGGSTFHGDNRVVNATSRSWVQYNSTDPIDLNPYD